MAEQIANLPAAISNVIQTGLLDLDMQEALMPALLWRPLFEKRLHKGGMGEGLTLTRDGLIAPGNKASAIRTPGQDPATVTRSVEQYSYQINPFGNAIDIHLPSSYVAQSNRFRSDTKALIAHAAMTMGRIARDALYAAYAGGDTFASAGATSTTLVVQDATGFDMAVPTNPQGPPAPVSAGNPLAITVTGVANTVIACNLATNTLTLGASTTWAQYDRIQRVDAPFIVRAGGRTTARQIISSDIATLASFRLAAAYLRNSNVPGIDGNLGSNYGCYVDADIEQVLFADAEIRNAMSAQAVTGIFEAGVVGVYAGIQFMRMPKTESIIIPQAGAIQAPIHRSIVFGGGGVGIEAYIPEAEFAQTVQAGGVASPIALTNHYKMPLDPDAVMALVLRAPIDKAGEILSASWLANSDYCIPTDVKGISGPQRVKRACVVETAGPA